MLAADLQALMEEKQRRLRRYKLRREGRARRTCPTVPCPYDAPAVSADRRAERNAVSYAEAAAVRKPPNAHDHKPEQVNETARQLIEKIMGDDAVRADLSTRMQRIGRILSAAYFGNPLKDESLKSKIDRLSYAYSDLNTALGFLTGLAGMLGVPNKALETDARNGQNAGISMFQLLAHIVYVVSGDREGRETGEHVRTLAALVADMLFESAEMLEIANDIGLVSHADLVAVRQ